MFGLGVTELSIVLVIALVIFGGKKLRNLGGDLGGAISAFKEEVSPENDEEKDETETTAAPKSEAASPADTTTAGDSAETN